MSRVLLTLSCSLLCGCLFDADLKHDLGTRPAELDDGWEIATPESAGISSDILAAMHRELMREDRHFGTLGALVIKDGKLVWETYLRSMNDRDHVHHIQSATKTVTSLALGIARDDGLVPSLEMTTGELFPSEVDGLDARKAQITLHDLLTMRSGLEFDNEDFSIEMWVDKPKHPLRYMLDKPLYADPGERFYYRDVDSQLVGYALDRLAHETEGALVTQRLFSPLGIDDFDWERGPDGVYVAAHGLHLRPRDLAKLGQLMLDAGVWRGTRLVSAEWLELATRSHVDSTTRDGSGNPFGYGYYTWIVPGIGYAAWGHGGQFVLVVPDRRLVLVQIALPDTDDLHGSHLRDFVELVKPLLDAVPPQAATMR